MFFQRAKMGKIWNLIIGWRHSFIRQKEWHIFYFSSCLGCQEIQRYILQLEEEFSFIWVGIIILYFCTLNANPWTVSLWMLKAILCLLILLNVLPLDFSGFGDNLRDTFYFWYLTPFCSLPPQNLPTWFLTERKTKEKVEAVFPVWTEMKLHLPMVIFVVKYNQEMEHLQDSSLAWNC